MGHTGYSVSSNRYGNGGIALQITRKLRQTSSFRLPSSLLRSYFCSCLREFHYEALRRKHSIFSYLFLHSTRCAFFLSTQPVLDRPPKPNYLRNRRVLHVLCDLWNSRFHSNPMFRKSFLISEFRHGSASSFLGYSSFLYLRSYFLWKTSGCSRDFRYGSYLGH